MSKKTRVLFTIPNFVTAGSQYVLLSIIQKLDRNLFEVFIGVEDFPERIPNCIPDAHKLHLPNTGSLIKNVLSLSKTLRSFKIDILHSWDYKSNFMEALACRLTRTSHLYTKKNAAWSRRWFLKSVLSSHIAYDHPEMKTNFFKHRLLQSKASFIPHGVDLEAFKPSESFKDSNGLFKLCCIGNIGSNKNQLFIIEQLKELPHPIHLYLYGNAEPSYLREIENYIDLEGLQDRVYIQDFVENKDLPKVLNTFDLCVLASEREGLPVSVLEALACGVPVLCSDSGGGTRYIFKEGKGGYVFDLKQPQQFKEALLRFYQDEDYFKNKKKEAVSLAKQFDILKEVKAYELLYQQL